jgi:hypothetical protein
MAGLQDLTNRNIDIGERKHKSMGQWVNGKALRFPIDSLTH